MNSTLAPIVRIALRYGVGLVLGPAIGIKLAADPDIVIAGSIALAAAVEATYALARRKGWAQ
jgi:hypothetical protein